MASKKAVTIGWILVIILCGGCRSQREAPVHTPMIGETAVPTTPKVANSALTANDLIGLWDIPPNSEERLTAIVWIQLLITPQFPGQIILTRLQGQRQGALHNELVNYELHGNQITFHTGDADETYAVQLDGDEMTLSNGLAALTYCNLRPPHEGGSHCAGWSTETP